ncbi:hypothetical protein [Roseateles violae]|uniref:Uncharacterized protein n=1 Tax=Roseateles violae TaxID=3058042 RepID=A0ABT8DYP7_9BURK|nr:hypothetical protein [Pelomonas sp. PFR6]MDN3922713.1 hypothetical protein [Pelomonas sp. PFR6]
MVLSLLFSQLVLANYVCPAQQPEAASTLTMTASSMPCEDMDMEQPALCAASRSGTPQSFEESKVLAPVAPLLVHVLELTPARDAQAADTGARVALPRSHPPPAPLFLSTLRLRV